MSLIPKIKIEVTFDELCEVCDSLADITNMSFNDRTDKIFRSVLNIVTTKLLKKQLSKRHISKFSLSLEYYEAHFLESYLIIRGYKVTSLTQQFINKLNQKLG